MEQSVPWNSNINFCFSFSRFFSIQFISKPDHSIFTDRRTQFCFYSENSASDWPELYYDSIIKCISWTFSFLSWKDRGSWRSFLLSIDCNLNNFDFISKSWKQKFKTWIRTSICCYFHGIFLVANCNCGCYHSTFDFLHPQFTFWP